ncbi:MAG: DUF502 domain-containing protein [bacterium]|nr:DUF502 domain-containing protein [bacterium]
MTLKKKKKMNDDHWKRGAFAKLRGYFFAGLLLTAPISLTIYLTWAIVTFIDERVKPLIPVVYHPEYYLPFDIPGFGLLIAVISLTLVGALMAGVFGRYFIHLSERILNKMPIVRGLYGAIKQIFETLLNNQSTAFRKVVMIEYPRKGIWSLGFITGVTKGEVQDLTEDEVVNVFIPTTPNPTSGYLLFVPSQDIHSLDMSVEEGIKMVVSAGILTPKHESLVSNTIPSASKKK